MTVNTTLASLSQTASSNGPDGSVDAPSTVDDAIRYLGSFIALLRDGKSTPIQTALASASTTDIGAANTPHLDITGTTTITSLGTNYTGMRVLKFTGILTLTYNATTLVLPTAANITTAAGDYAIFIPKATAGTSDGWVCAAYQKADGTALAVVAQQTTPPVRQTVLSGPVDSNGFAAFVGATGSTTVTATGTLKATAAAGGDANYTGSITNPSWTGLSTNGTMYLYLDITSAGVVTTGSTTLQPTYQWGGTYSTTNLQNTFNIQEMTMKMGNGSTAVQVYRVFVGEVTVAGGVVTAITWYALMGRYKSADTAIPAAATPTPFNHNIGTSDVVANLFIRVTTANGNFALGRVFNNPVVQSGTAYGTQQVQNVSNTQCSTINGTSTSLVLSDPGTGGLNALTASNFRQFVIATRGW